MARFLFLGCYTKGRGGDGEGITRVHRDPSTGALRAASRASRTPSPSFVVRHPNASVVYAVNELAEGLISAFAVSDELTLTELGSWSSGGSFPCHLAVDPAGRHLLIANYGSGSVAAFALDANGVPTHRSELVAHSGRGAHAERQDGPHAHMVAPTNDGVLAVDLGVDTVFRYRLDRATGRLGRGEVAFRLRPGTGPRHLVRQGSRRLHVVGELDATVTTYGSGEDGAWHEVGRVATSANSGALPSEIAATRDYLYVANRGPDTISVFALAGGFPSYVGEGSTGGTWPRHFALVDGFLYVANERSHTVVVFRLDPVTGMPVPTGDVLATPSPTCVLPA